MLPTENDMEERAALLPKIRTPERARCGNASVSGAVFNVSTSIIGGGIMSIPATLKILGVFPALVVIVVIALLAGVSVDFLLKYTYSGRSSTYAGVMEESFGVVGSFLVKISIITLNLGCLTVYLIIIGDVLCGSRGSKETEYLGILQEWFGVHWWNSREIALLLVVVLVLLPLVSYRRVESLRYSSGVSVFLAVVFVAISSGLAVMALFEGKAQRPRLLPRFGGEASFLDLFTAIPVIVTAFTFHFNVHPIGMELGKARDMMVAVQISLTLCAAIYFMTGFFGYLLFGNDIMADFLLNFNRSSTGSAVLNDVVRLSYALHLVLVYPLLNFSLRGNVDELLFSSRRGPLSQDTTRFFCLSSVLVALCYAAAIAIPSIWFFFQFIGSTFAVCVTFVFPGSIALRDIHGISTVRDKIIAALMVALAVVTSAIAIFANIYV